MQQHPCRQPVSLQQAAGSSLSVLLLSESAMQPVTCELQQAGSVRLILSVHSRGAQCTPGVDADEQF